MKTKPLDVSKLRLDLSCSGTPYFTRKAFLEICPKYVELLSQTKETLRTMGSTLEKYISGKPVKGSEIELLKLQRLWDSKWKKLTNKKIWDKYIVPYPKGDDQSYMFSTLGFITADQLADAAHLLMESRKKVADILPYISHVSREITATVERIQRSDMDKGDDLLKEIFCTVVASMAEECTKMCDSLKKHDGCFYLMRLQIAMMLYQVNDPC